MSTPRRRLALVAALALPHFALALPAKAQETTRVSVDSLGAEGNSWSESFATLQSISADKTIVAFSSGASNLVSGDSNGVYDVFVHDLSTGLTERVSVDSSGTEGNGDSWKATLSADGRFVAFVSYASNLVAGDANGYPDVFVHDRSTGMTECVSVDSSGAVGNALSGSDFSPLAISADGQFVAFTSGASNLVTGDSNATWDVFVHDRSAGTTENVSVDSSGVLGDLESHCEAISADGQVVVFYSFARNLVANDTNLWWDVFVHDRATGITERVSVDSSGAEVDGGSDAAAISADGTVVAFTSTAWNLVTGDSNGNSDVFVHDRSTGITERVSVDSAGVQGNSGSKVPTLSADARFVAFSSDATNLVAGDANKQRDVFVHDRTTGVTGRVSVDSTGADANAGSYDASISADGQLVLFSSDASDLVAGDGNGFPDVFVRDRCDALWLNYGIGFPGTSGVPSLTSQTDPILGTTVTVDLANSSGSDTAGLLFLGFQRATIHSSWGGDLLVLPFMTVVVGIPAAGTSISGDLPDDDTLCGITIDLQAFEADSGAAKGVSFTAGLELVLGR